MDLLKVYARMCSSHFDTCEGCPLNELDTCGECAETILNHYDEAVKRIAAWAKEYPQKTYAEDLLEKFPKFDKKKFSVICRETLYDTSLADCNGCDSCQDCWNQPMEE